MELVIQNFKEIATLEVHSMRVLYCKHHVMQQPQHQFFQRTVPLKYDQRALRGPFQSNKYSSCPQRKYDSYLPEMQQPMQENRQICQSLQCIAIRKQGNLDSFSSASIRSKWGSTLPKTETCVPVFPLSFALTDTQLQWANVHSHEILRYKPCSNR